MKRILYFALTIALGAGFASCSQDLNQDPPFNYPPSGAGGGSADLPENCIMRMTFDGDIDVEGPHDMLARLSDDSTPVFAEGHNGKAYQAATGKAVVINPLTDVAALKNLGSFTLTLWINFDGSNKSACSLFAISYPGAEIGNLSLFLEGHGDAGDPELFFFKGFMADKWFDKGDEAKITSGIRNKWAQMGLTYDAATSTLALYRDGVKMTSAVYDGLGALTFGELNGFSLGAFPSMVGLSDNTSWPSEGSWYTGLMDDLYLYNKALSDTEMAKQYQDQMQ